MARIESINALTLATHDMARAVAFYSALGFETKYGGADAEFTSFFCGSQFLNVIAVPATKPLGWWGRAIFHVDDVDGFYANALAHDLQPEAPPSDAPWGERFFHISDPDGHELSFARLLAANV